MTELQTVNPQTAVIPAEATSFIKGLLSKKAAAAPKVAPLQVVELAIYDIMTKHGEEFATKLAHLADTMELLSDPESVAKRIPEKPWRAKYLAIATKKGSDEGYSIAGNGGLFTQNPTAAFPKTKKVFPLFVHTQFEWSTYNPQENRYVKHCSSMDGVRGFRRDGNAAGQVITCGTNCPNMPAPKRGGDCKYGRHIVMVDSDFSNIYVHTLKNAGIDEALAKFQSDYKYHDGVFFPTGGNWATLSSLSVTYKNGTGTYLKREKTDEPISAGDAAIIEYLTALVTAEYRQKASMIEGRGDLKASAADLDKLTAGEEITLDADTTDTTSM